MDWDDARFFLAVAREGQILRAARRLGTSQSRVNRRISRFENAVGDKLFDRTTVGCSLTEFGRALLPSAIAIEEAFLGMESFQESTAISGTVRIGAPDGFGVAYFSEHLHELRTKHPDLKLQLVPAPQTFSLSQREADIVIAIGRPQKGRLKATKLTDYTISLYASRSYLRSHGTPETIQDLHDHALVGYVDDLIFTKELEFNSEFLSGWSSQIEISSALAQVNAVKAGAGIGALHDFIVRGDEELVPIFPDTRISRNYWIVWHESMDVVPSVSATVRFIIEKVRQDRNLFTGLKFPNSAS